MSLSFPAPRYMPLGMFVLKFFSPSLMLATHESGWLSWYLARLLATAGLWVRIQASLKKIQNGRHKQWSSQHTQARQKIYNFFVFFRPEMVTGGSLVANVTK
jgi:hypothetical protein